MPLNRGWILFHLREAKEELDRTIDNVARDPDYGDDDFGVALAHLYNHVNTAWNSCNATEVETDALAGGRFYQWRAFPQDIDMTEGA